MKVKDTFSDAGFKKYLVRTRRQLHRCAEVGFEVKNTVNFIKKELADIGLQYKDCGIGGLTTIIEGARPGRVFLLRADIDALPVPEESGEDFASANGNMHACGHDMHAAMLLGAARLLASRTQEINGTVKLMFQPAEELLCGAKDMISSGVLETPKVDAALMIHVIAGVPLPTGTVIVPPPGVSAPAADCFEITVQGKGCHGAAPQAGVDPITASAHILLGLSEIVSRELGASSRAVLTVGRIAAGESANVIPDTAVMAGSLRAYDEEIRKILKERTEEVACSVAKAFRAQAKVDFISECPPLLNDAELVRCAEKYLRQSIGDGAVACQGGTADTAPDGAGSEDFAYISQRVPSVMLAVAAGNPEDGYIYPQHHPRVRFDESVLPVGSRIYAETAVRWLQEHP